MDYEEIQEVVSSTVVSTVVSTREGEKIVVLARQGRENTVIGRYADGRIILFADESAYTINPGDTVKGTIVRDAQNYVIVDPEEVLGDTLEALVLNLQVVSDSGYYQHQVLAKALLYLIQKGLKEEDSE